MTHVKRSVVVDTEGETISETVGPYLGAWPARNDHSGPVQPSGVHWRDRERPYHASSALREMLRQRTERRAGTGRAR